jgi:hypothetical protein
MSIEVSFVGSAPKKKCNLLWGTPMALWIVQITQDMKKIWLLKIEGLELENQNLKTYLTYEWCICHQ